MGCAALPRPRLELLMSTPTTTVANDWHRYFAVECHQTVWKLLEKPQRSPADDLMMLHAAHASYFHWLHVGKPENEVRGEWMCSRVYAVLHQPDSALRHAQQALVLCEKHDIKGFDLAYAYEAMARAYAAAGQRYAARQFHVLANGAGMEIADEEDRKIFVQDLHAEPWFGVF